MARTSPLPFNVPSELSRAESMPPMVRALSLWMTICEAELMWSILPSIASTGIQRASTERGWHR